MITLGLTWVKISQTVTKDGVDNRYKAQYCLFMDINPVTLWTDKAATSWV